jgi:hypothetical protein
MSLHLEHVLIKISNVLFQENTAHMQAATSPKQRLQVCRLEYRAVPLTSCFNKTASASGRAERSDGAISKQDTETCYATRYPSHLFNQPLAALREREKRKWGWIVRDTTFSR